MDNNINLINKEYSTIENMKIKQEETYISTREILEIVKLEKMQQMYLKNFISNFDYEYVLNIETIRTHINIIIKKLYSLENDSFKNIKNNIKNTKIVNKILNEVNNDDKEKFEEIKEIEEEEINIIENIKKYIKKMNYLKLIREDLDLINRLKIIAENENDFTDEYINNTLSDFSNLIKIEYINIRKIIKLIFEEYKNTKEENKAIKN